MRDPETDRYEEPVQTDDTSALRDRHLGRSVRWFVAEFAVVVSGVLVALALNAYYQGRQQGPLSPRGRGLG